MIKKTKTALISVSDKNHLSTLLKVLKKFNIKIISSGGTHKKIKTLGYKSVEVSKYTEFPEILNGRVKTLHPKIYSGILSNRKSKSDYKEIKKYKFNTIDLVIVNFYPFEKTLKYSKNQKKIIENIDIGGPTMARAAAKNYESVSIITSIDDYKYLVKELYMYKGGTSLSFRRNMSEKAFLETGCYDSKISRYFSGISNNSFGNKKIISLDKIEDLRYGENPHQNAAIYNIEPFNQKINQLSGKQLSFNNYNDLYSALSVSKSLPKNNGTVIVKHANPCGISIKKNKLESFKLALKSDPISAFGGIVACNFKINAILANELKKVFFEIIVANGFEKKALKVLKKRKNLRLIDASKLLLNNNQQIISNFNTLLVQSLDTIKFKKKDFKIVSKSKPNNETMNNLIFAFNACRFIKSNAIVITRDYSTVGIGSGQSSRVDSCEIAINKMRKNNFDIAKTKLYAASDAFFPFVDGLEKLVQSGVSAVIQPRGSKNDKEIINFANKVGIVLVFSNTRHFKH